jgi:hypothetical protein
LTFVFTPSLRKIYYLSLSDVTFIIRLEEHLGLLGASNGTQPVPGAGHVQVDCADGGDGGGPQDQKISGNC